MIAAVAQGDSLDPHIFDGPVCAAETLRSNLTLAVDVDQMMDFRHRDPIFPCFHKTVAGTTSCGSS